MIGFKGPGYFFSTTPLSFSMHITAIGLGLGSWVICALIKVSGPKLIHAMPEMGEDAEALESANTFSSRAHNAVAIVNLEEEADSKD